MLYVWSIITQWMYFLQCLIDISDKKIKKSSIIKFIKVIS